MQAKVLKSTGKFYNVLLPNGEPVLCRIRGKIRMSGLKTTNPVAVGDEVIIDDEYDDEGRGMITDVMPRRNYIVRKSTNLSKQMQILAANVDRAYLLVTLHSPNTHLAFIDRFLVSTESFRIPCTLLFNKIDQYSAQEMEKVDEYIAKYEAIGYPCYKISTFDEKSIDFLRNEIYGQQVMIGGHSGVGKSSLINALDPSISARIGEISQAHSQGQHTTTFAEMFPLKTGGFIVDTPGIRAFGIIEIEKEHIGHYFKEIRELMDGCKFNNCKHLNEPQCAVKEALKNGEIAASRYDSYWQMMMEDPNDNYRKNIYG
ncbi:MAG: ribosome small subunit-dependent GTPase A [Crocinitomicaceae bacterium]